MSSKYKIGDILRFNNIAAGGSVDITGKVKTIRYFDGEAHYEFEDSHPYCYHELSCFPFEMIEIFKGLLAQ